MPKISGKTLDFNTMKLNVLTKTWIDNAKKKSVVQLHRMLAAAWTVVHADYPDEDEKEHWEQEDGYKVLKAKIAYIEKLIKHSEEKPKSLHEVYEREWRDVAERASQLSTYFHVSTVEAHKYALDEARKLATALNKLIYKMGGE